jgi:hypothetical protein
MFSLKFDETPQMLVKRGRIFQLRSPGPDQLTAMRLLDRLGMAGRREGFAWERESNWITAEDERTTFGINELSGGLRYRLRPLADEPGTAVNTSESRLEEIARGFLDRLGRPTDRLTLQRTTYLRSETTDADGHVRSTETLDAGLVFTRMVEELPVIGPGGIVMVNIGTDETVVAGREVWRPILRGSAEIDLRSPDEAISLLERRLKKSIRDGELHVRKARMGYAELGIEQKQTHLEPCYAFMIETSGDLVDSKKIEVIPAASVGPMASAFAATV